MAVTSVPIDAASSYRLGGCHYTGHQLQRALHCAHSVARAYEIANVANGGGGSVDWIDIDDAQREAADAMGPLAMRQITAEARDFNDFESPNSEAIVVQDEASLLTPEESAEACAEGWSLFTHFDEIVELRLERIDSPDEGDGALLDDAAAWQRVWTRATPLHRKVIDILKASSPAEHARIEAYVHGLKACHAHA
jgi:hypothetical protein